MTFTIARDPELRLTSGEDWVFEAGAVGEQLTFKYWRDREREPAKPQLTTISSAFSSGLFGVGANVIGRLGRHGLVNATFDDIYFTPVAPTPAAAAVPEPNYEGFHAAALYRAGQFEEAADRLGKLASTFSQSNSETTEFDRPWTLLFLSMALHQLGDSDAARAALDKAVGWMGHKLSTNTAKPVARIDRLKWFDRLRLNVLRHEAEQLLGKPKGSSESRVQSGRPNQ